MGGGASTAAAPKATIQDFLPLVEQVKENGEARLTALKELNDRSLTNDSKILMASDELGLVALLVEVITSGPGEAYMSALGVLWNLTCGDRNEVPMARKELGVVAALVHVVKEEQGEARIKALGALWNLTFATDNKVPMASDEVGLVAALVKVTKDCRGEARIKALGALWKLTYADDNTVLMARDELGLVAVLVSVVREDKGEPRIKALGALWNLTFAPDNLVPMARDSLGLVKVLIGIIALVKGQARVYALGALGTLTHAPANKIPMTRAELGLVAVLMKVSREEEGQARVYALGALGNLTGEIENGTHMAKDELGLVALLVKVANTDVGDAQLYALTALGNLTGGDGNQGHMARDELGVVSVLMLVVRKEKGSLARVYALGALQNLTHAPQNREHMARDDLGLVSLLIQVAQEDEGSARVEAIGALWNLSLHLPNCAEIVKKRGHVAIVQSLKAAIVEQMSDEEDDEGLLENCLSALMSLVRCRNSAEASKAVGALSCVSAFFETSTGANKTRAAFILALLAGKDETGSAGRCFLAEKPSVLDMLLEVVRNNINRTGNSDMQYKFGHFELAVVMTAIANVCISDSNKAVIVDRVAELLPMIVTLLRLFADNAPPIAPVDGASVGGGGEDIECANACVEILAHLALHYENADDLRRAYTTVVPELPALLHSLVDLPPYRNMSLYTRKLADNLLFRITQNAEGIINKVLNRKHLTISCANESNTHLPMIEQLSNDLKSRGYDVWSNQQGSVAVPATEKAVDRIRAIEMSAAVVICMCAQYKDDALCCAEARHIIHCQTTIGTHVVYVVSDEEYSQRLEPEVSDGWLSKKVRENSWTPFWNENTTKTTSEKVSVEIESVLSAKVLPLSPRATGTPRSPRAEVHSSPRIDKGVRRLSFDGPLPPKSHVPKSPRADIKLSPRADFEVPAMSPRADFSDVAKSSPS